MKPSRLVVFIFGIFFLLVAENATAAVKTFTGPGNFSDPTRWNLGTLPVAGDDLRINGVCTFDNAANNFVYNTLNVGFSIAGTLQWPVGGTNTLNVTTVSSTIAGSTINMTNGGTLQIRTSWTTTNQTFTPGTGTINWNVTAAGSTLPAARPTYYNLIITSGAQTATLGVSTTVNNNLTVTSGTFNTSTLNLTVNGTTAVSGTYSDLSNTGTNIFVGQVAVNAGAVWSSTLETTAGGLVFRGGIISNGTSFLAGSATFNTNPQTVSGSTPLSFSAVVTVTGVTVTNNTTINITSTASGALAGTGVWTQGSGSILNFSGNTITLTTVNFNSNSNTVNYSRAGTQTVRTATYRYLSITGSGTKTLGGVVTVNNDLTVNTGTTLNPVAQNLTVNGSTIIAGTFGDSNTGGITSLQSVNLSGGTINGGANGVVNINGTLIMPTGNGVIGRVVLTVNGSTTVASSRTLTLNNNNGVKTFVGAVMVSSSATWVSTTITTTANLVFRGGIINNGTSFTAAAATFNTNAQALSGTTAFNFSGIITVTGVTLTNNATVNMTSTGAGALAGTGTWTQGASSVLNTMASTITITTVNFSANSNTVNYNRAGTQTVRTATYRYLSISGSSTKSLGGAVVVNNDLTISTGVALDPVAQNLTVNGSSTVAGTLGDSNTGGTTSLQSVNLSGGTINGTATGIVNINGALTMPTGNGVIGRTTLTVNGSTTVAASRTLTLNSNTGVKIFVGSVTISTSATWVSTTVSTTSNLVFQGGINNSGTSFSASAATFNTNAQALSGTTVLDFSGIVTVTGVTLTNNTTVSLTSTAANVLTGTGGWTQGTGSVLNIASSSFNITSKDFSSNSNTVNYNGNIAQVIHNTSYSSLSLSTGASSVNKTIAASPLVIAGDLTLTNGTGTVSLLATTSTIDLDGNLSGNGTLTFSTGTLNIGGDNTHSGTFTAGTGLVNYNGSGSQIVRGTTYNHLTIGGANTKTLGAAIVVNGNLIISSTLSVSGSNYGIELKGNWDNTGVFVCANGTTNLTGAGQTITNASGETFYHLTLNNSGTILLNGDISTNGNLTIASTSTLDITGSNYNVNVKGAWTNDGTFLQATGTVTLNGSSAQTVGGSTLTTFHNLTLANAAGASLLSAQNLRGVLQLNSGTLTTNNNLTLTSDATYTGAVGAIAGGADISGNVTIQRFAPGGRTGWVMMGAPVNSALTYADWDDDFFISCSTCPDGSAGGFTSIYTYDETVSGAYTGFSSYVPMTGIANPITSGKGYYVYLGTGSSTTTDIVFDVTGSITKFNYPIQLSYTNTGSPADDGWNMIANPYPSPVSWAALRGGNADVEDAIYGWNADLNAGAGGFASYVGGISNPLVGSGGIGDIVPSCQGFFVHATAAATLTATEGIKTTGNPTYLKTANHAAADIGNVFRLFLDGQEGVHDETVLHFSNGASRDFDSEFDAFKLLPKDMSSPYIASEINDLMYSINGLPVLSATTSIPVKVITNVAGTFTISPYETTNLPDFACISLYDKLTGITHDLRTGGYKCYLYDTTTSARFILTISTAENGCPHVSTISTTTNDIEINPSASIEQKENVEYFIGRTDAGEQFMIIDTKDRVLNNLYFYCVDLTGRVMLSEKITDRGNIQIRLPSDLFSKGIYIVNLTDNTTFSKSVKWVNE